MIRVGQGSEFAARDLDLRAYQRGVTLDFSRPGKPTRQRLHRVVQRQVPDGVLEHVESLPARSSPRDPPFAAAGQASKLSADDVLQHHLVKR
jgi:transposase InsO family protein